MDVLKERVKEILIDILNLDFIDDNACQEDYAEWDSMAYLSIVAAIEDEFGIAINGTNINKFNTIPNILKEMNHGKSKDTI